MIKQQDKPIYPANGGSLELDSNRCTGCGLCLEVCPHAVFSSLAETPPDPVQIIARGRCMECGACALNCPAKAIRVTVGVGCVAAIIRGKLTGTAPSCDCDSGQSPGCC